jgi:hypothetical protein
LRYSPSGKLMVIGWSGAPPMRSVIKPSTPAFTQQKEGEADIESQWSFLGQGVLGGQRFLVPQYEAPANANLSLRAIVIRRVPV